MNADSIGKNGTLSKQPLSVLCNVNSYKNHSKAKALTTHRYCLPCRPMAVKYVRFLNCFNFYTFVWDRVLCSLGWPQTQYMTEAGFELLIFLPLPPKCWDSHAWLRFLDFKDTNHITLVFLVFLAPYPRPTAAYADSVLPLKHETSSHLWCWESNWGLSMCLVSTWPLSYTPQPQAWDT